MQKCNEERHNGKDNPFCLHLYVKLSLLGPAIGLVYVWMIPSTQGESGRVPAHMHDLTLLRKLPGKSDSNLISLILL